MTAPLDFPSLKRLPAIHHRAVKLALATYRKEAGFNEPPRRRRSPLSFPISAISRAKNASAT